MCVRFFVTAEKILADYTSHDVRNTTSETMALPEVLTVLDSRLPDDDSRAVILEPIGPSSVTYQSVNSADGTSTIPIFSIELPSQLTGLSRTLYWRATCTWTVTGTVMGNFLLGERVALRQFPLQSMCSNIEALVNDTTLSVGSLSQILAGLLRVGNPAKAAGFAQSTTAGTFDTVSDYGMAVGRLDSPFGAVGDRVPSSSAASSRTGQITSITCPDAQTMVVTATVEEPFVIPPFNYTDSGRNLCIYGMNNCQISCNVAYPQRGLSLAIPTGTTITGTTLALSGQKVLCTFVTPQDRSLALAMKEQRTFRYDCPRTQLFATEASGTVLSGASSTVNGNSFQLPVIPEKVMVWVQASEPNRLAVNSNSPDVFFPITGIQIQAGTRAGLLSGATTADLWATSNRNGADIPYWQYAGLPQVTSLNAGTPVNQARGSGGPLILDVARDLSLPEGTIPGMAVNWSFVVSEATFTNNLPTTLSNWRLMVVPIMPGYLTNKAGSSTQCGGGVPGNDSTSFQRAGKIRSIEYQELMQDGGFGGAILGGSKVSNWFRQLGHNIKKSADAVGHWIKGATNTVGEGIHNAWDDTITAASKGAAQGAMSGAGGARLPKSMLYGGRGSLG